MSRYDPDFGAVMEPIIKAQASQPQPPPPKNVFELREQVNQVMAVFYAAPDPPSIVQTRFEIETTGGYKVPVVRFATAEQVAAKNQPAILYLHPGGMICGSVDLLASSVAKQAHDSGVQHWAVDYRKSPEVAAPVALEDSYAVLAYLSTHAAEHGIDPARIGVCGASAGGGMTAGIGLMARDRRLSPPLAKLIMIYPMLDDRTVQIHPPAGARHAGANPDDDSWPMRKFLVWTTEQNAWAWAAYLGVGNPATDSAADAAAALAVAASASGSAYSIPARATSLKGLPSTYIDVGGLDLFLEETSQFAAKLARDGVEFDLHVFRGLPHGFEMAQVPATKTANELRIRAMNSF